MTPPDLPLSTGQLDHSRRTFLRTSVAVAVSAMLVGAPLIASAYTIPTRTRGTTFRNVRDYGAVGDGLHDDTSAFLAAIKSLPTSGGTVQVPAGLYLIDAGRGIALRSYMHLQLDPAAILQAKTNTLPKYNVLLLDNIHDVEISGGTILGERLTHIGTEGEGGHCIRVHGAQRVTVREIRLANGWGDGITVGPKPRYRTNYLNSADVVLSKVVCNNNRRNGLSIGNVIGMKVYDSEFSDTNGTKPQCGIDVEPDKDIDGTGHNDQVWIENCVMKGNAMYGVNVWNRSNNLTITRCTLENNLCGIVTRGVTGFTFTNNTVRQNKSTGVFLQTDTQNVALHDNTFFNNYTKQGYVDRVDFSYFGWKSTLKKDLLIGTGTVNVVVGNNFYQ